jgi:hypothetical protein
MMERRVIVLEESKNGAFLCRDGRDGPEFGRAASLPDALQVIVDYLTLQNFEGEGAVLLKPWRSPPFSQALFRHTFKPGENKSIWKRP